MSKRFSKFGLTIFPFYGKEKIDWNGMNKEEIVKTLTKLKFIRPLELVGVMKSMKLKARTKRLKTGEIKDYYSEIIDFGGQLELTKFIKPYFILKKKNTHQETLTKLDLQHFTHTHIILIQENIQFIEN